MLHMITFEKFKCESLIVTKLKPMFMCKGDFNGMEEGLKTNNKDVHSYK